MTDHEDIIIMGKIVFDDNNQERKSGTGSEQACSRHKIVFFSQNFVVLLKIFCCFWRIHPSKTSDESVGVLCTAPRYLLPSLRLLLSYSFKKSSLYLCGHSTRDNKITISTQLARNWNLSNKIWQYFLFRLQS